MPVLLLWGHKSACLGVGLYDEQCLKCTAKAIECWFADSELVYNLCITEYSGFVSFREIFFSPHKL